MVRPEDIIFDVSANCFYIDGDVDNPIRPEAMQRLLCVGPEGMSSREAKGAVAEPRVAVHGVRFFPGVSSRIVEEKGKAWCNTYTPPSFTPEAAPWPRIEAILKKIAGPQLEGYDWMLNWMAAKMQNIGRCLPTALVWVTPPGTGKNTMLEIFRVILGPKHAIKLSPDDFARFKSHFDFGLIAFIDEIKSDDRKNFVEALKADVGNPTVRSEKKFAHTKTVANYCVFIFASNDYRAIPVELYDRRFGLLGDLRDKVSDEHKQLCASMFKRGGGLSDDAIQEARGFWEFLLRYEVKEEWLLQPPKTRARAFAQLVFGKQLVSFAQSVKDTGNWKEFASAVAAKADDDVTSDDAQRGQILTDKTDSDTINAEMAYKLFRAHVKKVGSGTPLSKAGFFTDLESYGHDFFDIRTVNNQLLLTIRSV